MSIDLLQDRVCDTVTICEKTNRPKFLGFLSEEQAAFAGKVSDLKRVKHKFHGGYDGALRVMLGCFPDWADSIDFPISALTLQYRSSDKLTHRDFLGSLMALGLKRETVGDILIEDGRAVIFLADDIADYVISQLEKVGRVGVAVKKGFDNPLPVGQRLTELSSTVPSLRLDCIVAALCGISRNQACEKIEQSFVQVNSVFTEKITRKIEDGDVISVRGSGKFVIVSADDITRKNRIILKYKKYI